MSPIGGYFELELLERGKCPFGEGVLLNSGRNALEYILLAMGDVRRLFVPYYTCDVVLEPLHKLSIPYTFYHINQNLELSSLPSLKNDEYLIYTNYFGIKDEYVKMLADRYALHLIVDNAQALFARPIEGVNTIYSPRKYVGLPDGGIVYCVKHIDNAKYEQDVSYGRCSHLLKRIDLDPSEGYGDFKANSAQLIGQPIKRMSKLTKRLLCTVDFGTIKIKRRKNFEFLHEHLVGKNNFIIPSLSTFACPMVYPYLTNDASLRQKLIDNKIFVATYWPNVKDWTTEDMLENELMERLLPIPCDQRYGMEEMNSIVRMILKCTQN